MELDTGANMTDQPAAIQATFADFRLIKGRKQAQLVLEIPIEEADKALAVLGGIPQPQSDCWVAVARLNGSPVWKKTGPYVRGPEQEEKQRWEDLKLSMQAGIRCKEQPFWRYIQEKYPEWPIENVEDVEDFVRQRCDVQSRKGLNTDEHAALRWKDLERSYQAWLKAAE
jgi:hypothetical protein